MQQLERHCYEFPFAELGQMAQAIRGWLNAGSRPALGDREELREAVERVSEYPEFAPRRGGRREMNRRLRALSDQEGAA